MRPGLGSALAGNSTFCSYRNLAHGQSNMTNATSRTPDTAEGWQLQGGLLLVHVTSLDVRVLVRVLLARVIGVFLQVACPCSAAVHVNTTCIWACPMPKHSAA